MPGPTSADKARARRIFDRLGTRYPDAHCALIHDSPFQLLTATALSAQCTDKLVNQVTPELFRVLPTPQAMAKAPLETIASLIGRVNFWRNKSKNLHGMARMLVDDFGGQVPETLEELIRLPGVARKTANVVMGNAFNKPVGVVVDTHAGRLARRFGLSRHTDPIKVERDLMALYPQKRWTQLTHLLIEHGRAVCKARHALCDQDSICRHYCTNAQAILNGDPPIK